MPGKSGRFGRADRLRKSKEFRRVTSGGRRQAGAHLIVLCAPRGESLLQGSPRSRLGVTVSRKVGGAVVRNLVKRRLREWFRRARPGLSPATDFVVIARSSARAAPYPTLAAELDQLTATAGAPRG